MAAGQIYKKAGQSRIFWRDSTDVERSAAGADVSATTNPEAAIWVSGIYLFMSVSGRGIRFQGATGGTGGTAGTLFVSGTQLIYFDGAGARRALG